MNFNLNATIYIAQTLTLTHLTQALTVPLTLTLIEMAGKTGTFCIQAEIIDKVTPYS